ncbi:MAG: hypothetical protein NTV77_03980, partial [Candidatus Azambacteria bacterium]|nr:hypothetical protein [Candidatus Azambacteria bacterium]
REKEDMRKLLALLVLTVVFAAGYCYGVISGKGISYMFDGIYRIISIQRTFDEHTGEPTYMIAANFVMCSKIDGVDVCEEKNATRLYEIPRDMITNLPDDGKPALIAKYNLELRVENGEAIIGINGAFARKKQTNFDLSENKPKTISW